MVQRLPLFYFSYLWHAKSKVSFKFHIRISKVETSLSFLIKMYSFVSKTTDKILIDVICHSKLPSQCQIKEQWKCIAFRIDNFLFFSFPFSGDKILIGISQGTSSQSFHRLLIFLKHFQFNFKIRKRNLTSFSFYKYNLCKFV